MNSEKSDAVAGQVERRVRTHATHTPGPWQWWTSCSFRRLSSETTGRDGDVLHAVVQRSDGHADVHLPNGGWDGPDGRLIAAAPELLAVLRKIINSVPFGHSHQAVQREAVDLLARLDLEA